MSKLNDIINNGGVYTIAEMSANHAGSLKNAIAIVQAAKNAGADCLKIQTYTADSMTLNCNNGYFKIKGGLWDGYSFYDLYTEASTPYEWQPIIKEECDKVGIDFLSTPFDKNAVDFLESLGVTAYKIASFELVDIPLIKYTASKSKLMIISTGMGSLEEIQEAVNACKSVGNNNIILLKCTSEYPVNINDMNLSTIPDLKKHFELPVGLSDHSMGSTAAIAAVALGAVVIEKHFCLDRKIKNPDSEFSSEPYEFAKLVQDVKDTSAMRGKVFYGPTENEKANTTFRRSIFVSKDIKKGDILTEDNIRVIRPNNGAKPKYLMQLLGSKAQSDINYGDPLPDEWLKKK